MIILLKTIFLFFPGSGSSSSTTGSPLDQSLPTPTRTTPSITMSPDDLPPPPPHLLKPPAPPLTTSTPSPISTAGKATSYNDLSHEMRFSYGSDSSQGSSQRTKSAADTLKSDTSRSKTDSTRSKGETSRTKVLEDTPAARKALRDIDREDSVISSLDQDEWSKQIDQLDHLGTLAVHSQSDSFSAFQTQSDVSAIQNEAVAAGASQQQRDAAAMTTNKSTVPPQTSKGGGYGGARPKTQPHMPPPPPQTHSSSHSSSSSHPASPLTSPHHHSPATPSATNRLHRSDLDDLHDTTLGSTHPHHVTTGSDDLKVSPSHRQGAALHLQEVEEQLQKIFTPAPAQIFKATLSRKNEPDFGLSLSDGVYEKGVYVSAIRPGGPAQQADLLPFDRILQVWQRVY